MAPCRQAETDGRRAHGDLQEDFLDPPARSQEGATAFCSAQFEHCRLLSSRTSALICCRQKGHHSSVFALRSTVMASVRASLLQLSNLQPHVVSHGRAAFPSRSCPLAAPEPTAWSAGGITSCDRCEGEEKTVMSHCAARLSAKQDLLHH